MNPIYFKEKYQIQLIPGIFTCNILKILQQYFIVYYIIFNINPYLLDVNSKFTTAF